jgi:hypothetical protein
MGVNLNVHFEKEKAPLRELIELCDVALALIRERRQLLKLLRADAVGKEGHDIFNATFKRLKNLERVSHQIRLAFRNPVGVEDDRGRLKAFGKRSAGVLHGPSAVRQQPAGAIMHGDSESAAHNAPR